MRTLCGEYDRFGYRIFDARTGRELYSAGNHPGDSQAWIEPEYALPVEALRAYCERTGREMAQARGAVWAGSQAAYHEEVA